MDTIGRSLVLKFGGQEVPYLARVEFLFSSFVAKPIITDIARGGGQVNWSPSVIGLGLCFIAYKIWEKTAPGAHFQFDDKTHGGSAASFAGELEKPNYVIDMFGYPVSAAQPKTVDASAKPVYRLIFSGVNRSGRNKTKRRIILIKHGFLPPDCVTILWDQKQPSIHELQKLAIAVQNQWEPHRRNATPPGSSEANLPAPSSGSKTSAPPPTAHAATSTSAEPITSSQTKKKTPSQRPKERTEDYHKEARPENAKQKFGSVSLGGDAFFEEWLKSLRPDGCLAYVEMLIPPSREQISQLRKHQNIYTVARALANVPLRQHSDFYGPRYIPKRLKVDVSAVMVADPELKNTLMLKLKESEDLLTDAFWWFHGAAEYYPWDFRDELTEHLREPKNMERLKEGVETTDWTFNFIVFAIASFNKYSVTKFIALLLIEKCLSNDGEALTKEVANHQIHDLQWFYDESKELMTKEQLQLFHRLVQEGGLG
jgi:hypothetical protein